MIRRLIILLLIVGCDNSTESEETCEICEVKWILFDNTEADELSAYLYWIEEYNQVIIRDTTWFEDYYLPQEYYEVDKTYISVHALNDKSIVESIYHYKTNNYFEIKFGEYNNNESITVNAIDCSTLKYEYK